MILYISDDWFVRLALATVVPFIVSILVVSLLKRR
jgi:hypothetical protein